MRSSFDVSWLWKEKDIKNVVEILKTCNYPVVHICSGASGIGDYRLDIKCLKNINHCREGKYKLKHRGVCNVLGDMNRLPFKSGVAGSVVCDPPYDYDFTKDALISELIRICKPGGKIVFIAPWVPCSAITTVLDTQLWKVGKNRPYHKIMSILVKSNGQIEDYL